MKALLVNIDLMVRVVVPDDATEEQIIDAAANKALDEILADRNTLTENVAEWKDDTSVPYDPQTDG